ncbi:MAG: hypothetical protein HFE68_06575 [Erysipelotrichaceae bacterium]|nr:hypothetical protein [Erysipelotrichaceae bacterium]
MVERFEKFSYAIFEISRCWHRIASEELAHYGLKGAYATYFTALYRYPQGITASKLGELCARDKADVSRALALLEQKGMLVREEKDGIRYRAKVCLTKQGRLLAEYIMKRIAVAMELGGAGLNEDQRLVLYACLDTIIANLHELSERGLPQADEGIN